MASRAIVREIDHVDPSSFNPATGATTVYFNVIVCPDDGRAPFERQIPISLNLLNDTLQTIANKVGAGIRTFVSDPNDSNVTIGTNDILALSFTKL